MSVIPLGDASRRPVSIPVVTLLIILTNVVVFAARRRSLPHSIRGHPLRSTPVRTLPVRGRGAVP